jgi:hypothetical protein
VAATFSASICWSEPDEVKLLHAEGGVRTVEASFGSGFVAEEVVVTLIWSSVHRVKISVGL